MCGIIGYIGENVKDRLLDGLEFLEYRGYDSAGVALQNTTGEITVLKKAGRVSMLKEYTRGFDEQITCGIGHTRWATHGGVCDRNAHPHEVGNIVLVHNGIIENYRELIEEFHLEGVLISETDSEVVAALLDHFYSGDPKAAIGKLVSKLKGTYALVILFKDLHNHIFSVRNVSPIVATICKEGAVLASDSSFICRYTDRYFVLPEYHILELCSDYAGIFAPDGTEVMPEYLTIDWKVGLSGKGDYPFYMEKEIMEQPEKIKQTMSGYITSGMPDFSNTGIPNAYLTECNAICIVACGTALHAGMVGQTMMKRYLQIPVETQLASEFIYGESIIDKHTLFIAVSQSGETIDTLEAIKIAKGKGAMCIAVLNVKGSAISREADYTLFTDAGPEIAVASTKAYTTQMAVFYLLTLQMALKRGKISSKECYDYVSKLCEVPEALNELIKHRKEVHIAARTVLEASDLFMVGRGLDYTTLMEGSLKLKEVSYIHSEAYASGELKHGPIALITEGTPVVSAATQKELLSKTLSNMKEMKSRGADLVVLTPEDYAVMMPQEYHVIVLPKLPDELMTFPVAVALQLFAYYVSADKGFDVDKPKNLAKVVTVE